jgi:hypothetical protein
LLNGKCLTEQLARYLDFIADYNLVIRYKAGEDNKMADRPSRIRRCEQIVTEPCKQCRAKQVHVGEAADRLLGNEHIRYVSVIGFRRSFIVRRLWRW